MQCYDHTSIIGADVLAHFQRSKIVLIAFATAIAEKLAFSLDIVKMPPIDVTSA